MKSNVLSSVCTALLVFAHFLAFAPYAHAQHTPPLSPIEGLRFDTPLPEKYTKKTFSLYFLASYDLKSSEILMVKKTTPTPTSITASVSTSPSLLDILTPVTEASAAGIEDEAPESTDSAEAILAAVDLPIDDVLEETVIPSPSPFASVKKVAVSSTPKNTATPKPTTTPTEKPITTPKPTVTPTATPTNTPTPAHATVNTGGLSADRIFELVNNYRASKGLPAVQKDERACEVARSRAPEIGAEISGGYMHKGIRERKLPYFNSEIIISMRSEEEAVKWWINDYIHRVQMEGDYKYSCAACHGNSCVQEFTNFVPRG